MNAATQKWRRAGELFDLAIDLDAPSRASLLQEECAHDPELRRMVERLLEADAGAEHLEAGVGAMAGAAMSEEQAALRTGERWGPYRIERMIGQGGMGEVYLARREQDDFERCVAIKMMSSGFASVSARRRFLEERRLLARLEHPHIARLYDGGLGTDGQPWYAMEYVDGAPLIEWCDRQRLDTGARLALFAKICDAVDHAHRQLIVHRDIKPGNILVDARGEPRLLDFGIAKLLAEEGGSARSDTALMTPDYAAPEQLRSGAISTATDVYALGAVLFELLTGQRPFADPLAARDAPSVARAIASGSPALQQRADARAATVPSLRRGLRGDADRILRTALDPEPSHRYRSAAALGDDLRAVASGRAISLRSDRGYRLRKFVARHRWAVSAGSLAVLALLAALGTALHQQRLANERARTATAVKDFVASLLESSSAEVSLGKELSVREVLDRGRGRLSAELSREPAIAVELLTVMARSYASLENYPVAAELFDQAERFLPRVDDDRRADLYSARLSLAIQQGNGDAIRRYAVALHSLLDNIRDPGIRVTALLALAQREIADKDPQAVDRRAIEAMRLARSSLPPDDPRQFRAMGLHALSRYNLGDPEHAIRLYRSALAEGARVFPPQHPELGALRDGLYVIYIYERRDAEAAALARQILDYNMLVYGKDSTQVAKAMASIVQTLIVNGDYRQARPLLQRALLAYQASPAKEKSLQAAMENRMAQIERAAGRYPQAQQWYERAVASFEGSENAEHSLPYMRLNVANMMARSGHGESAAALYQQALQAASADDAVRAVAWTGLGELAREQGDARHALELHLQAMELLTRKRGADHFYTLGAKLALARDQKALGRLQDSEATLTDIVQTLDRQSHYQTPELNDAYFELGQLLASQPPDRRVEAKRLLGRCLALRERMFGPDDPRTREARTALQGLGQTG